MPGKKFVEQNTYEKTIRRVNAEIEALKLSRGVGSGGSGGAYEPVIAGGAVGQYYGWDKTMRNIVLPDSNLSNSLGLVWNEDRAADQTLNVITGAANRTVTLQGDPTLADWFDQAVKVASSPTHKELTIGPNDSLAYSKLIYRSYFDSPTNIDPQVAGWLTAEGTGITGGTPDVPAVRGTEWDYGTNEFIAPASVAPNIGCCISGGKLFYFDTADYKLKGFLASDGSADGESAAGALGNVFGACSDGTYVYTAGQDPGGTYARQIRKYLIADYSLVATKTFVFGTGAGEVQSLGGMQTHGGFLYLFDYGNDNRRMLKLDTATMTVQATIDWPNTGGNKYRLTPYFCMDAGAFIYCGGRGPTGDDTQKSFRLNLADLTVALTVDNSYLYNTAPFYIKVGIEERIFTGSGSDGLKINPATLAPYYVAFSTPHVIQNIVADGAWLYVGSAANGIDRRIMNPLPAPDTRAGLLRLWVNVLGVLTEGARLDDDLNFTAKGAFISEVATGTAPFQPASVTMCPNLNADLLDGNHAAAFAVAAHAHPGVYDPAGTGDAEATAHVAAHAALVSGVHGEDGEAVDADSTIRFPAIATVPEGGTGLDTVAANSYLKGAGAGALVPRTPAEVLSDIGAAASGHNHSGVYDPAGTGDSEATAHVAAHAALVSGVHGEDGEAVDGDSTVRYPALIQEAEVDTATILTKTGTTTGITNKTFDSPITDDLLLSGQAMLAESSAAVGKLNYATDAGREAVGGQALEAIVKSAGSATYHRMILDNRQDCVIMTEIIGYT
jgi:hypothetical protein